MMGNDERPFIRLAGQDVDADVSQIALRQWQVKGRLSWPIANLRIRQVFENRASHPLEVVYTFPLSSDQILEKFEVILSGKRITSRMVPREDAWKQYEVNLEKGDFAAHLQQHRSNIFSLFLGNMAPGEKVLIDFYLSQVLEIQNGEILLRVPTVVGPRYIPGDPIAMNSGLGWAYPTNRVPDADEITPPFTFEPTSYSVQAYLEIARDIPVQSIESPSHPFQLHFDADNYYQVVMGDELKANKDIVLKIKVKPIRQGLYSILTYQNKSIVAITLTADEQDNYQKGSQDLIFLIDISGSMAGEKLETTVKAVQLCLRKLSSKDRFQLVAFESVLHPWKKEWVPVSDETIQKADRWLRHLDSLGGTELLSAVQHALQQCMVEEETREPIIVLLTDGQVGNEWEIARVIQKSGFRGRMLLFGIDTVVNQELFSAIQRMVPAITKFIYPGEDIRRAVNVQFQNLATSWIRRMYLNIAGEMITLNSQLYGLSLPLSGNTTRVLLFETDRKLPQVDSLQLIVENGKTMQITLLKKRLSDEVQSSLLKYWGKQLLENQAHSDTEDTTFSRDFLKQLALDLQLPSPYTDWIALWEREEKIQEIPRIQVIPVNFPDLWNEEKFCLPEMEMVKPCLAKSPPFVYLEFYEMQKLPEDKVCDIFLFQKLDGRFSFSHSRNAIWESLVTAGWLLAQLEVDDQILKGFESNVKKLLNFLLHKQSRFTQNQKILWNYLLHKHQALIRQLMEAKSAGLFPPSEAVDKKWYQIFDEAFAIDLDSVDQIKNLANVLRSEMR